MPASIDGSKLVEQGNWNVLVAELRRLDKDLFNEMRREFRGRGTAFGKELAQNIPNASPISGFTLGESNSFWQWKKPTVTTEVKTRVRGRGTSGTQGLVSIKFNDRRPTAGFSILERAGSQTNNRLKKALNTVGRPQQGRVGRFVIPQFYRQAPRMNAEMLDVLAKYAQKLNRNMKSKGKLGT
jgi:hypothetical protein